MTDFPHEPWFYSHEGERLGPVSFAELRVKAVEGELDPRQDMVWTKGMENWQPAGAIETLFERRLSPVTSPANPYLAPQPDSVGATMQRQGDWPGAGRRAFLTATILLPVLWHVLLTFGPVALGTAIEPALLQKINLGGALGLVIVGIVAGLQRLANLGMSRWWYLGQVVPILNLWIGYRCFACPAGYAYHKQMDGIGIALAIFYWLLIVVALLGAIAVVVVLVYFATDPRVADLIRQMREAFEQARAAAPAP